MKRTTGQTAAAKGIVWLFLILIGHGCGGSGATSDGDLGDHDTAVDGDTSADGDSADGDGSLPDGDGEWWQPDGDTLADGDMATDGDGAESGTEGDGDSFPPEIERLIEEADLFRYDGARLVLLNRHAGLVRIHAADPPNATVTGRLPLLDRPDSFFLRGDLAVVMGAWGEEAGLEAGRAISQLTLADLTEGRPLRMIEGTSLDGRLVDSRWVGEILYVVVSEQAWTDRLTGERRGADRVRLASFRLTADRLLPVDEVAVPGRGLAMHVDVAFAVVSTPGTDGSTIHLIDISDRDGRLVRRASIPASGEVRDRYKLQIRDRVLYAVGHTPFAGGTTFIESWGIDDPDHPQPLGFLSLAPGEELHATIFQGSMLYLVTYLRLAPDGELDPDDDAPWNDDLEQEWNDECRQPGCDPLWTIDLSDPADPRIVGELIIPGWSEHLVFRDGRLFAVGLSDQRETKVSIFDVRDPWQPREEAMVVIPGFVPEPADALEPYDFKSLTILWERGLMLVPVHAVMAESVALIGFATEGAGATLIHYGDLPALETVRRTFPLHDHLGMLADSQFDVIDIADPRAPRVVRRIPFSR